MLENKQSDIEKWFTLYGDTIFKYFLLNIHEYQQAEDLTQETFVKAFKHYHSFKRESNPKTWLFSIAHNLMVDYLRKKRPIHLLQEILNSKQDDSPLPSDIVQMRESEENLYKTLTKLKQSYREVIFLRKMKEFSIKETAEILNWSESKVKSTLSRAIVLLKKALVKEGDDYEQTIR
ncbi:RNA polymerase sigma factor [Alkalihalobacillus sp. APA_J-10(15)]|nr:RNA polymerase sigma factor [Halalkalibacter sp. APA_J-10(15)]